jgi:hypothetical protein
MAFCAVCGSGISENPDQLPEPSAPPDFDTRPGEPLRSTISRWVHACPSCGYCADDLTRADPRAGDIVASPLYREALDDTFAPEKARHFLAYAVLLEKLRQFADAGWSALHAAWVCDDAGDVDAAVLCRARAIELWKRGKQVGQLFCDDMASEFALVTDLHRRMGQFEHATVTCGEALDLEDLPPAVEVMLHRQLELIQNRDTSAHNMSELIDLAA